MSIFSNNYKLDEKVDTTIERVVSFIGEYYWYNIDYSSKHHKLIDWEYSFNKDSRYQWFKDILALNYIWAINLDILNFDSRENGDISTNIDIDKNNLNFDCNREDYLYKNYDNYVNNIELHSSLSVFVSIIPYMFMNGLMKIIFQEKDISKLPNYKILDELVERIKSEINWKSSYLWDIEVFYDFWNYIDTKSSIYPILYELQERKIVKIKEIELKDWYIIFKLNKINDINSINKKEIINLFWSTDKLKILDNKLSKEVVSINLKLDFKNWFIKNNWNIIIKLTKSEKEILFELNKTKKEWWISKENLRVLTNKPTDNALNQSIKGLKNKLSNSYVKDYIVIDYKKWEKVYYLTWKYFEKVEKKYK